MRQEGGVERLVDTLDGIINIRPKLAELIFVDQGFEKIIRKLQHSNYFDEIARLISSFTEVAIVLSYELVEGLNRDVLSDVASIGAHFKTMLKLAPRNVQDLEPILAKFQEMTSTILQLEAEGTPQLEVLAQAKRLLGSYRRFLSDREVYYFCRTS